MRWPVPSRRFAPEIGNAELARRFVADALRGEAVSEEAVFVAQLLTTELVTNAVRHARSPVEVTLVRIEDRIRVEARDQSTHLPVVPDADSPTRHRGLLLIEDLAQEWGAEARGREGKVVWFELLAG